MAKSFEEIKNRANEKKKEKKTFEDIKASVKNSKKVYDTGTSIQDYKQWASGIESLSERLNSYLDTSTYKAVDDSLTKDVSSYLSQSDSMLEFVRGNRSRFEDYSKALSQIYSTKNALSDAMHEINKASSYYSNWDNEEEFLKDRKEANYKFEEQDKLRIYDLEDGKKAIAEAKKNLEWAINERDNYVYEPLPDNSQWLKSYTTPEAKARAKEEMRLEEIHDRELWVDMYEEQLREAEDYYEKAERAQNAYKLASVSNPESEYYDPEFERYAQMGEAIENPSFEDAQGLFGVKKDTIQNPVKFTRENYKAYSAKTAGSTMNGGSNSEAWGINPLYMEMTEDEYRTYNYHLAQDQINSRKGNHSNNADIYIESLDLKDRQDQKTLDAITKYAGEHPVSASALSVVTSLGSGAEYLQDIFKYASTGEMDRNIMADITNTTRGTVSKKVDWEIGNWDAFDFLYNTGMSGVDSLTSGVIFGPAGGAVLGLSAAAQGTNDALDRGLSGSKVFWNGLTAGVFEGLFETVSIGQFDALKDSFVKNGKDIIKNLAKTMVVNASEETLTEIANLTYDRIVNGDFSQYEIAVRRYMEEEGMTEAEAKNKVAREQALQVVEAGASGALMGFGFGSIGSVANNRSSRKAGKNIIEAGEVDRLVELGEGFSPGSEVREFAGKINKDSSPLAIGRLLRGVQGSFSEQNFNDIQTALVKKGVDLKEAETIAKWMNLFIEGGKLTKKQLTALENNNDLAEVLYDTIIQPNSAVMQRNQMYKQLYDIAINKARKANGETITNSQLNTETNAAHKAEVSDGAMLSKETERSVSNDPSSAKIANVDDKVSNTGATFVKSTGEEVSIKKIASIDTKNKTMKIELNDGNVVDSKDISYGDKNQALLYENVLRLGYDTNTANAIISGYTPSTILSVEDYLIGTRQAYNYGWGHIPEKARTGIGYKALTPEQRAYAYKLGEDARAADDEARGIKASQSQPHISKKQAKGSYGVKLNVDQNTVTDRVKESVKVLDVVSKALKVNITVADLGGNAYGFYNSSTNELVIDVNAGGNGTNTLLFTASHELVHYIREWSPKKFTTLADFLMEQYAAKNEDINALIQEEIDKAYRATKGKHRMTFDEAYEEVVAQAMQRFLTDSNFIEHLSALQKKDANLAERLVAKLKEILDNIRAAYQGIDTKDRASQAVQEIGEAIDELYAKMEDALITASKASQNTATKNAKTEGDVKAQYANTTNYDFSKSFSEQVDDYKAGTFPTEDTLMVGGTPKVWQKVGFNALPVTINQTHVEYALNGTKDADHHIGEKLLKGLPEAIQEPLAIIQSQSKGHEDRAVVILKMDHNGKKVISAIEVDGQGRTNSIRLDSNAMTTLFAKGNGLTQLKNAINNTVNGGVELFYWNKKEAITLLQKAGLQLPSGLPQDGFVHSITDVGSKVKTKFSDVTETQQFKRWFGNWKNNPKKASKVVNKDGTPRIVYHYTNEDFTVFDTSKSGTNQGQTHGDGIYLSTSADEFSYAGKNKMELYANIRKPFEMELTDKQATYVLEKYATKKHDLDKFNGSYRNHALSKLTSPTRVFDYLTEYAADNGVKVSDILKDLGYDGVHDGSEWVAFDRNQVKSATDNIGTYDSSNPDIRYQYADERLSERYTYEELTSKPDMKLTVISDNVPKNRADVVSEAKKNASKIGKFNSKDGSVSVHVADVGEDVVVSTGGLRHSLDRRFAVNAPIAVKAGEILQNSIKVNEMIPENANADSSYVLIGAARNEKGELYIVRSVVNRFKSELVSMDVLYAINAKTEPNLGIKKENQAGAYPQGSLSNDSFLTDSTISISQLIDYVNKYFPDVLPESVLRHYGYDARPDGELGEDVLYQYKDVDAIDNRTLLAKALESVATTDLEKQKLKEYQSKIDLINAEEKKLSELRAQIKELSFSKGKKNTTKLTELQIEAKKSANRINIYDKQLLRLEAAKPLANVLQREKDLIRKKMDQQRKEAVKAAKEKEMAKMQEMSARYQESRKKAVERRNTAQIRNKIRSFKEKLEGTLLNPTDKRYVPFGLAQAVVDVCSLIDTDTDLYKSDGTINKTQAQRNLTKERLQALKDEYEKLKGYEDPVYSGEFDDAVYDMLNDLKENYEGRNLKEMNLDELRDMYDILRAIGDTLADARNLIGKGEGYDVYEAGYAIINEQREVARKRKKDKRSGTQKAKDGIINLSLAPIRNVERMSGYKEDSVLVDLFNDFEIGVRQQDFFEMEAKKSFETVKTGENAKVYESAVYDAFGNKSYMDDNGKKFGISKMQMMQAILSQDRERANGMNHIKGGGLVFADLDLLCKGKLKEAISTENSHLVSNAESVVEQFRQELANDKWAQEYMAVARAFFDGKAKDAINNTMLTLKHRIVAKDNNYIPFEVDQSFVVREISAANDIQQTINSYGMLQKTKDRAPQPLIMTGLNNIIDRHIDQVSVVVGLAIPVRNFNKVWNVHSAEGVNTTVNGIVETNWGVEGKKHIEQAVQDIQGPRHNNQSELYKKIKSGYIGATFLLNGSVVTKQIGSMFAATSMLRWRDPASMMGNLLYTMVNYKKIAAEVDKYTASAWKRRQGMSDAEVYSLITEGKKHPITKALNKLPAPLNPAKWITAMDSAVALSLWKYAKQDVQRAHPELTGEELNRATASFYDSLIENTQSMTDVLHRPEIQKRSDIMSETFGMFKTDLYQMSGQLQSAAGRFSENKSKENAKHLGRTVYSIAASAIWGQLMTTAFALLRYKVNPYRDDEDDELTVESWLKRQSFAFGGDLMGYFLPLFGSEVVGTIENIVYGESEDIADSLALTAINDLYSTAVNIASSLKDGEAPSINDYKKLLTKSLQVFGVPANNILRTIEAIHLHSKDIANGEFFSFEAGRDKSNGQKLYEAILSGNQTQIEEIKSCYEDEKAVQTAIKGEIKKRYVSGEIDYKTATEYLIDHCGMDAENIYWEMQTWEYAAENGTTEGYSKYDDFLTAVETGKKLKTVIKEYTENGVSEKTLASQITRHFKPLYVEMSRVERAKIKGYLLNAYVQLGYDRNEKSKDIDRWLED